MKGFRLSILAWVLLGTHLVAPSTIAQEPLMVVSSIKPLQMLATAVGGDKIDSQLLLPPNFSPHDARLKPSQWQQLERAGLVLWVGPELEQFLASAMRDRAHVIRFGRELNEAVQEDPHLWMSVEHVAVMAARLARELARRQPSHEAYFMARAARLSAALRQQHLLLKQTFTAQQASYLLPHRGYTHFERQYGLAPAAVISKHAETMPGTAHIVELRSRLRAGEFTCVFREPQHESPIVQRLLEEVAVKQVRLDPMGANVENGESAFVAYYRELADAFVACVDVAGN